MSEFEGYIYADEKGQSWFLYSKVIVLKGQGGKTQTIYFFSKDPAKRDKNGVLHTPALAIPPGRAVKMGRIPLIHDPNRPPKPPKKRKKKRRKK